MTKKNLVKIWCPPEFKHMIKTKAAENNKTMINLMSDMVDNKHEVKQIKKNGKLFPKW